MKNEKTFVIQIKGTQASTWQGTIVRVEEEKKEIFRSTLELIKLLDSAVKEGGVIRQSMGQNIWDKS